MGRAKKYSPGQIVNLLRTASKLIVPNCNASSMACVTSSKTKVSSNRRT